MVNKYRLSFGPSIKKGAWYYGVNCKGCKSPIFSLKDPSNGGKAIAMVGGGLFSIPCLSCGHDDLYAPGEMRQIQATQSAPSHLDQRPKPSGAQKYPFLPRHRKLKCDFGPGAIELRPEIAQVIARIVLYWTNVEIQMARLLSVIMKANTEPAIAVYLSLRNARQKAEALEAAASLTLESGDYDLFLAIMRWKDALEKERNDIVHGVIGICRPLADSIIWVSTTDAAVHSTKTAAFGLTDTSEAEHLGRVWVYKIGTLERIAREIEAFGNHVGFFLGYLLSGDPQWRAKRYPQLCSEPRIQKELRQVRQSREK